MCEELSYQIINTSAVNHKLSFVIIRSLQKIIIEKKTIVLTVASKAEIHFFDVI